MIEFQVLTDKADLDRLVARLSDENMHQLMLDIGNDAVMQIRRNIVTEGKASGSMAPLSGYNQGGKVMAKERNRARKVGILEGTRAERRRDKRIAKDGSRHAGYAAEKQRKFEEGKLEAGADQKLVATGDLERSLYAEVMITPNSARVEVRASGNKPSGISNDALLSLLAFGTDRMPARNPALNMQQVEARAGARVEKLLGSENVQTGGGSSG